ncbi:hypothetical protein IGI04_036886 [Brassica rapa subsp. trilocularis]|uniref:Wall-associated receptor kinase C-terminal domain-containing protein n=1 Tax=Brassica rapa subsp. trilocularis TaxID=1813537 RepID=A0ABQ7LJK2_BRACM|nr:hypothetical protein IGI04_036886 [Brassica rapa subsp. trilocularis]
MSQWYRLKSVSQANTITVTDPRLKQSLETGSCSDSISFSLPDSPWLDLTTLYKSNNSRRKNGFTYANCNGRRSTSIKTPESWVILRNKNQSILNATFSLHIHLPRGCILCHNQGGECRMIKNTYSCVRGAGADPRSLFCFNCNDHYRGGLDTSNRKKC